MDDRLNASLQQIALQLEGMKVTLQQLVQTKHDHELRLRFIERWRGTIAPFWSILVFALGSLCMRLCEAVANQ